MDDHPTSIGELKITEVKINKLTIGKLIIGRISQVPPEKASADAAESPQVNQPVTDDASPENPSVENVESPKETPTADTAGKEASPRSSFPIDKINIGGISTVLGEAIQEKASEEIAESPQENQPVTDEASPESLFIIDKPVQENPSSEIVESQKETPSADTDAPSQETPSSEIVEASAGSSSTMVDTSQVVEPSSEIAGFEEENPLSMGEVASPESIPEERQSTVVPEPAQQTPPATDEPLEVSEEIPTTEIPGPAQETTPATDVASSRGFTMKVRPLEDSTISNPEVSEEIQSTEFPESSPENPPVIPEISQENPSVETAGPSKEIIEISEENQPEDPSGSPISNPEVSSENLSTEVAESLQENPLTDMAGTSIRNPPDGDFSFSINALKLKLALDTLSDVEFNPSRAGRYHIDQEGFRIDVLNPSDIYRHIRLNPTGVLHHGEVIGHIRFNASELQNFKCSMPMGGQVIDLRPLWYKVGANDEDTVTVYHTQGSDKIDIIWDNRAEPAAENPSDDTHDSAEPATEKPSDDSAEPAIENPSDDRAEPATENPSDDSAEPATEKPSDDSAEPAIENPSDDRAEPATENPSDDSAEPATENPSNNEFSFDMKPACKLKLALEILSNTMFNPSETGRIDVSKKGFRITVLSPSDIFGYLWLKAEGVQNFQCSNPMAGKLVNVAQLLENLQAANDQDTITVSYTQGSDEISFTFGEKPMRGFIAEFLEHEEIPECPEATVFCHSILTNKDMELVSEQSFDQDREPQLVTVDMTKDAVIISVGMQKIVHHEFTNMGYVGTYGMKGDQRHIGRFYWIHVGVLKKAALLSSGCILGFVSEPPEHFMLLFTLQQHEELGQLMFLKKADRLIPNLQEISKFQSKD